MSSGIGGGNYVTVGNRRPCKCSSPQEGQAAMESAATDEVLEMISEHKESSSVNGDKICEQVHLVRPGLLISARQRLASEPSA